MPDSPKRGCGVTRCPPTDADVGTVIEQVPERSCGNWTPEPMTIAPGSPVPSPCWRPWPPRLGRTIARPAARAHRHRRRAARNARGVRSSKAVALRSSLGATFR